MEGMTWQDVQRLQNAAFLQSQIICAQIKLAAMQASNEQAVLRKQRPTYTYADFLALADEFGVGHNSALATLAQGT